MTLTKLVLVLLATSATSFTLGKRPLASRQHTPLVVPEALPSSSDGSALDFSGMRKQLVGVMAVAFLASASILPAVASTQSPTEVLSENGIKFKLPPVSRPAKDRCEFVSSSMGQANGARDSQPDFRGCSMVGKSAAGYDLSGAIMSDGADLSKVDFKDAQISKGFLRSSKFDGADFTNGIVDRCDFEGASLKGALFTNTVLTSTSFKDADLTNTDFSDAYLGDFDLRKLCKNPTLEGENPVTGNPTRASAGCR